MKIAKSFLCIKTRSVLFRPSSLSVTKPTGSRTCVLPSRRDIHSSALNQNVAQHPGFKFKRFNRSPYYQNEPHVLQSVYTETGALKEMPKWLRFGFLKIAANIVLFVFVGSLISKTCVTFLEENDIFKPEEDDDEDDD
jgi:hypothetical protein